MKRNFILAQNIVIPVSATPYYNEFRVKSEELYKFITGIAGVLVSGSLTGLFIQIKDDRNVIFDFTDAANWIKTFATADKTNMFRPCNIDAGGKNIYIAVKADVVATQTTLSFILNHTDDNISIREYNFDEAVYTGITYPLVGTVPLAVHKMPSKYAKVLGVAAIVTGVSAETLELQINDSSQKSVLQRVNMKLLEITTALDYDKSFMPVSEFASNGRDITPLLNSIVTVGAPPATIDVKIIFLLGN